MLRMIATGASQATSDALGAIAEAGRTGRITKARQDALDELFEQYFGPELVDVSSGIEQSPGKKDHAKLRKVFEQVRMVHESI